MIAAMLLVMGWSVFSAAQSVSPVSSVFTGGGKGDLTLTNLTLVPMSVTLQAVDFSVSGDKKVTPSGLSPHIHVKFSKSGVRIAPKDSVHIFFDASADSYPAWFMIYAAFQQAEHHDGLNIGTQLGHPVYMYQKENASRDEVAIQEAVFDPVTHKLKITMENRGGKLSRPSLSFPQLHDNQFRMRLLPVFPNQTTATYFDLSLVDVLKDKTPTSIVVEFPHFRLSSPVSVKQVEPPVISGSASASPASTTLSRLPPASAQKP